MLGRALSSFSRWAWQRLSPLLDRPRLGLVLAALAMALSSPALLLGFYLDDYIGRYIYSDLAGAARLFRNYSGGYGLAIGDPVENQWQREAGWAPWWQLDQLRLALWRPIGVALHSIDFRLWPSSALVMHAHNLLWLGALVAAVTWMYRSVLCAQALERAVHVPDDVSAPVRGARQVAGAAALLFALDQTHGFAVGHICNRHALVSAMLGALCLGFHARWRARLSRGAQRGFGARVAGAWAGPLCYLLGLWTSESSVAVAGYVLAHALFVESGPWRRRALAVAPYAFLTLGWRALYNALGYGAFGSSIYIDVGREPFAFLRAFLERAPILWLGQFFTPPAELYVVVPKPAAELIWVWAVLVLALSLWAFAPLLRRDRGSRAWALGMFGSLVPAAAAEPHNRQLVFASFGAMGLLAQLWRAYASPDRAYAGGEHVRPPAASAVQSSIDALRGAHGEHVSHSARARPSEWLRERVSAALIAFRLLVSPLLMPLSTASIALTAPMHLGAASIGDEVADRDLILVTAPEYFSVRMVQLMKRIDGRPLPRRIRAISCEPQPITVRRADLHTLDVRFEGGLLSRPMSDLHRDRRLAMPAGTKVRVSGFAVEVLRTTSDGRPELVRFVFDVPLEDPRLAFFRWDERRFVPFRPPALGREVVLPGAKPRLGLR